MVSDAELRRLFDSVDADGSDDVSIDELAVFVWGKELADMPAAAETPAQAPATEPEPEPEDVAQARIATTEEETASFSEEAAALRLAAEEARAKDAEQKLAAAEELAAQRTAEAAAAETKLEEEAAAAEQAAAKLVALEEEAARLVAAEERGGSASTASPRSPAKSTLPKWGEPSNRTAKARQLRAQLASARTPPRSAEGGSSPPLTPTEDEECTFEPQINEPSGRRTADIKKLKQLAQPKKDKLDKERREYNKAHQPRRVRRKQEELDESIAKMMRQHESSRKKLEEAREEKKKSPSKECTFAPRVNKSARLSGKSMDEVTSRLYSRQTASHKKYVAAQVEARAMKNIEGMFFAVSRDASGDFDRNELATAMEKLGLGLTAVEVEDCFELLEKDRGGRASLSDFMTRISGAVQTAVAVEHGLAKAGKPEPQSKGPTLPEFVATKVQVCVASNALGSQDMARDVHDAMARRRAVDQGTLLSSDGGEQERSLREAKWHATLRAEVERRSPPRKRRTDTHRAPRASPARPKRKSPARRTFNPGGFHHVPAATSRSSASPPRARVPEPPVLEPRIPDGWEIHYSERTGAFLPCRPLRCWCSIEILLCAQA